MEKACEECGIVTMCDSEHRICYDCFVEMDLSAVNAELKKEDTGMEPLPIPVITLEEE